MKIIELKKKVILFVALLSTIFCFAKNTIPKELHGFWQFQVAKKGDWNGMHISEKYMELWYNLAKPEKVTQTNQGYTLEVRKGTEAQIEVTILSADSAVFKIEKKEYRCKRFENDPQIEMFSKEKYAGLFPEKWYKRESDTLQLLDWKNGTLRLDGKTWRIIWLGDYLKQEYRALIESNDEYNLLYIKHGYGGKKIEITLNQSLSYFTTELTEDRSIYLANSNVFFPDSLGKNIESISMDFEVKNNVPKNIKLCVSPLFPVIQKVGMQAAVSSQTERIVKKIVKGDTICDNGGLLSRFGLLDTDLMRTAEGGIKFSGLHDGLKYITARNRIKWDKGQYRVRLFKSGYTEGKPLFHDSLKYRGEYLIKEYEHTWLTMTFEDLKTHKKWTVGSVAVPGKNLNMKSNMWLFVEIYGTPINFIGRESSIGLFYKGIPTVNVIYKNLQINDKDVPFKRVQISKEPDPTRERLGRVSWNKEKDEVECEIGYKE